MVRQGRGTVTGELADRADALIADHELMLLDLRHLRRRRRLSRTDVAARMGADVSTVDAMERYDADPTLSQLRRYAMAVGARLDTRVVAD
jgi:ribosome-binding protein aMBF1 (putative translation factor)